MRCHSFFASLFPSNHWKILPVFGALCVPSIALSVSDAFLCLLPTAPCCQRGCSYVTAEEAGAWKVSDFQSHQVAKPGFLARAAEWKVPLNHSLSNSRAVAPLTNNRAWNQGGLRLPWYFRISLVSCWWAGLLPSTPLVGGPPSAFSTSETWTGGLPFFPLCAPSSGHTGPQGGQDGSM